MFTLRSVAAQRNGSWDASGLVEKAWRRITPPRRDELARRMTKAGPSRVHGSDLSARNTGQAMTLEYAERIAAAVRQDDPTFSVADLGAPSSVVAETDPTALDRLAEVEMKYEVQRGALEEVEGVVARLEKRTAHLQARLRQVEQRSLGASR